MRKTHAKPAVLAVSERRNIAVLELLKEGPRTRTEIMHLLNLTKDLTHHTTKRLLLKGYIKEGKEKIRCPISGRSVHTYLLTGKQYDMTRANVIFEREASHIKPSREDLKIREEQIAKEEFYERAPSHIIKVNEHTTVFLNSKRPSSDYAWQRNKNRSRVGPISIASGMNMFRNWE